MCMDPSVLKVDTSHSLLPFRYSCDVSYGHRRFVLCMPLKRSLGLRTYKTGVVAEIGVLVQ